MFAVLCEKPSARENFATAFGGVSGEFGGREFSLVNSYGHLYELSDPHEQVSIELSKHYRQWNPDLLPWRFDDFLWKRTAKQNAKRALMELKSVFDSCSDIVIATDTDPTGEGDLLAWEILIELGYAQNSSKRIWRLRHADETAQEIRRAWREMERVELASSGDFSKAWFRQRFDFLSLQFTRLATCLCDGETLLKQGRLKSAMVRLVGEQEKRHKEWVKKPFYVQAYKDDTGVIYRRVPDEETRFDSVEACRVGERGWESNCTPQELSRVRKRRQPPLMMDLAQLSSLLATKMDMEAKCVLDMYQQMYQKHYVSYPRTEDKKITRSQFQELVPLVGDIARVVGIDSGQLAVREGRETHFATGLAHGANRPGIRVPESLTALDNEFGIGAGEIYRVIALSFLAMMMEDYVFDDAHGNLVERPDFVARLHIPVSLGWKALDIYSEDKTDADNSGGEVAAQSFGSQAQSFVYEGVPKRPVHPSMSWLMKQLEKYEVGTGATRTSTYSDMISDSVKSRLIQSEKKGRCSLTDIGWWSFSMLEGTRIGSVEMTEWVQARMRTVGAGEENAEHVLGLVADIVRADAAIMKNNGSRLREDMRKKGIVMSEYKPLSEDDYYRGQWQGAEIMFKRLWGSHRFTDDECAALFAGETIEFAATSKAGKEYVARGALGTSTFNGNEFFGFQLEKTLPDSWCEHIFSDEEKECLQSGKTVTVFGAVGKKGKPFNAQISYKEGKISIDNFLR